MNHSIYSADRMTHVKVVVIALVAGIGVAGFGIAARINTGDGYAQTAHVIKGESPSSRQKIRNRAAGEHTAMNIPSLGDPHPMERQIF